MLHINKFIDRLRGFEARGQKDFNMSLADAKDLHADITKLLLRVQALQEKSQTPEKTDDVIEVKLTGGQF